MKDKLEIVKRYFNCWIKKDFSILEEVFNKEVYYSECYGPAYKGLDQVEKWFKDWNEKGTVLVWDIKEHVVYDNILVCQWYFECEYKGKVDGFNGVSWITFSEEDRIIELKEYQSKVPIYFPYN